MKRVRQRAVLLALAIAAAAPVVAHESPIDHVDRWLKLRVEEDSLRLNYRLRLTRRAAILQLRQMDVNRDGGISDAERGAYFATFADKLTDDLQVELDGKALSFELAGPVALRPDYSNEYEFFAATGPLAPGEHKARLVDRFSRSYPGRISVGGAPVDRDNRVHIEVAHAADAERLQGHVGMVALDITITMLGDRPEPQGD